MNLNKINGNTYYINSHTNIGIYSFKNKNALLIDSEINNSNARKIDDVLTLNKLHPKYIINTHSHIDHCGGNHYFQDNYPGVLVYASTIDRVLMENSFINSSIVFSGNPTKNSFDNNTSLKVDYSIDLGLNKINDEKFNIIPLYGHTLGQIGIITSDRVCFLGDSIFSDEILSKYSFPYLFDIEKSMDTLSKIKEIDCDYFVLSHSEKILNKDEIQILATKNLANINNYLEQILELLDQPLSREDIVESLSILNSLSMSYNNYHLNFSSVCGFLAYLYNKNMIDYSIEDGRLYYFKKGSVSNDL
ncbi:MAG: MBL fold metallo-hydrolase [Clostridiaceae bacterium]